MSSKAQRLRARGVEVIAARTRGGRLVLADVLRRLAERDLTNILVEGGATVLTAFLEAQLVDEAWVFVAPKLIGGARALSVLGG